MAARRLIRREPQSELAHSSLDPVLGRVLANRGWTGQLDSRGLPAYELAELLNWRQLKGIEAAAALLESAIGQGQRILIVGDYDADGATGTSLALLALREFGAQQVDYLIPDRQRYGYGLSIALAEVALPQQPDLVITVDNGISSVDGVAMLKTAGVQVLITDHHLPGEALPAANAIVNPNQPGDEFPSKALAGVGVVFYLMLALRHRLQQAGFFADKKPPNLARYLDLVALGTVADLVPLDDNNRILVEQGLRRMRAGQARPGIQALIDVSGRKTANLHSADLGFALGPRLNAAGRLEHMNQGIECLIASDEKQALEAASQLDEINRSRREMQSDMQDEAIEHVLQNQAQDEVALCVFEKSWHEGIVGLVASRLKERFHRPSVAFAQAANGELKGSARSISGFHLRDALALVDSRHPGLIKKFGGHAMAAGLSLDAARFEDFKQAFTQVCAELISAETLEACWHSDGELSAGEISTPSILALQSAGPWGQAWDSALFDGHFRVLHQRIVGQGHLKLNLSPLDADMPIDAIAFGVDERLDEAEAHHLVFELALNDYYDPPRPQLMVRGCVANG